MHPPPPKKNGRKWRWQFLPHLRFKKKNKPNSGKVKLPFVYCVTTSWISFLSFHWVLRTLWKWTSQKHVRVHGFPLGKQPCARRPATCGFHHHGQWDLKNLSSYLCPACTGRRGWGSEWLNCGKTGTFYRSSDLRSRWSEDFWRGEII